MSWDSYEKAIDRGPVSAIRKFFPVFLIAGIALIVLWLILGTLGSGASVVRKTFNADNVIYNYEQFKRELHDALLAQYLEHMPGLAPMIAYTELSTPLSTDHFVRPQAGSIYGLEPTPERFHNPWLRPRAPIPGLFFAGSEVTTVGVLGAMMGGVLAALSAEPVGAMRLLASVRKR